MAGASLTEGEARANVGSVSSPSVTYGDTSPWLGRVVRALVTDDAMA